MIARTHLRQVCSIAVLALMASTPCAQERGTNSHPRSSRHGDAVIDIKFPGGPLEQFVGLLKGSAPIVNIVIDPAAKDHTVPPIQLRRTSIETALDVAARIVDGGSAFDVNTMRNRAGAPVHVIRSKAKSRKRRPSSSRDVLIVSIRNLTEDVSGSDRTVKAETVLTAAEAALGIANHPGEPAKIRYHADSGLLIVAGSPAQLSIVQQVVSRIQTDIGQQRNQIGHNNRARRMKSVQGNPGKRR